MIKHIQHIENSIIEKSTYNKEKSDEFGEVFTPQHLINEMLDKLPIETWSDPTKTFFDPSSGNGNFHIQVLKRLYNGLSTIITNPEERYKHIVENQLFFAEFQVENAQFLYDLFSINGTYNINLYVGDTLKMPPDFFDWDMKVRKKRWPEHIIAELHKVKTHFISQELF